jgi:hypothetical protein
LAVATDTLWVPSGTKANLAPQHRMGGLRMSPLVDLHPDAYRCLRHRAHANARCNRLGRGHRCALGPSGTTRPTAPDGRAAHVAVGCLHPDAYRCLRHRAPSCGYNARCNRLGRGHRCALGPSGTTRPTAPDGRAAHVALVAFIPMPTVAFAIVRHRAANRLDHVTLTPGATALAVRFMSQKHPSRPGRALNIIHP